MTAVAFGVVDALLWGQGDSSSATFWLSNLSSTYLLLAFAAGLGRSERHGAWTAMLLGAVAPVTALAAFYIWQTAQHNMSRYQTVSAFERYAMAAVVVGPLFGLLGRRWSVCRAWYSAAAIVTMLLCEPIAWRTHFGYDPGPSWIWTAERLAGVGAAIWFGLAISRNRMVTRPASS